MVRSLACHTSVLPIHGHAMVCKPSMEAGDSQREGYEEETGGGRRAVVLAGKAYSLVHES
jgi:hypothetical protein